MIKKIIFSMTFLVGLVFGDGILIEGRVSMKGSSIHSYLAIQDHKSQTLYKIENPESFGVHDRQNQTIKIRVKLLKKALGAGYPAVIKIMEVI